MKIAKRPWSKTASKKLEEPWISHRSYSNLQIKNRWAIATSLKFPCSNYKISSLKPSKLHETWLFLCQVECQTQTIIQSASGNSSFLANQVSSVSIGSQIAWKRLVLYSKKYSKDVVSISVWQLLARAPSLHSSKIRFWARQIIKNLKMSLQGVKYRLKLQVGFWHAYWHLDFHFVAKQFL